MDLTLKGTTHVVIGDTQLKEGVPTAHLTWIGKYIVDQFWGRDLKVIHLGDNHDMPSLSSYDKGKGSMEGRRYKIDIKWGNKGPEFLTKPLVEANKEAKRLHRPRWKPELHMLLGNHEHRIMRAVEDNPQLEGVIGYQDFNWEQWGWMVHPFRKRVWLDGIAYSHFFYDPKTGRPYGGEVHTRLPKIGHSFTMGHQQGLKVGHREVGNGRHYGLVLGSCLTPDHKVLTADLRYVALGDIEAGQKLVSFDEELGENARRGRAFKTGTVLATRKRLANVFCVTLGNGKQFKTTADHRWLVKCGGQTSIKNGSLYSWRATENLRCGTRVVRLMDEWGVLTSRDAGYLAGMYDGEGCYYERNTTRGRCGQLTVAQKKGPVLDEIGRLLSDLCGVEGVSTSAQKRDVDHLRIKGGMTNIAKVLGQLRPIRLLPKFRPEHLGQITTTRENCPAVVSVEEIGEQEIVEIDIDTKTMVVEGYAHHNCYLHDEEYIGPQGNTEWRGIMVCHQVESGQYDRMEVSLDFLCRRYEGVKLAEYMADWNAKHGPVVEAA